MAKIRIGYGQSVPGGMSADHNFEQCSKEKLNMHLHLSSNSVQDVDGLVARPCLVISELMKLLGRRLRMQLETKQ